MPPQPKDQTKVFLESEGDRWFERNQPGLSAELANEETAIIKQTLDAFKDEINHVLEIGCSNGAKLQNICEYFNASGAGVDPSAAAVNSGNASLSKQSIHNIKLEVSTSSSLSFADSTFDLVYFGFCLYLVDRSEIFKSIAEADRVLKNGGFLVILDFDPGLRHKRAYHHKPGLFSYKTSYADFFTSGGHYYLVAKESFSINQPYFSKDKNDRVSISILYKEVDAY